MRILWLGVGLAAGVAAGAAGVSVAASQKFSGQMFGAGQWTSTCSKPMWESRRTATDASAIRARNQYDLYVRCVQRQAEKDARAANALITEGANAEVQSVRSSAELHGWAF
jgi:hypothetical protein